MSLEIVTDGTFESDDIYDLRRQIDLREATIGYLQTEQLRINKLIFDMKHEVYELQMKLRNRKPAGEPRNKRYLYAPHEVLQLPPLSGDAIDGELE